jgi:hypothetical protein
MFSNRSALLLFGLTLGGCGNILSSPATRPTPPARFSLTGRVTDNTTGVALGNVTVTIVDGANAGWFGVTASDGSGAYTIAGLQPGGFTARARAQHYNEVSKGVTLTSNQFLNFSLMPSPVP